MWMSLAIFATSMFFIGLFCYRWNYSQFFFYACKEKFIFIIFLIVNFLSLGTEF